ncbi:MAG: methyltransferase domain-containing protein [Spirochaetales bacterium]
MGLPVLLVPSLRKNGGLGHLVRMMRLALSLKERAYLYLEPKQGVHWSEEEVQSFFPAFPFKKFLEREPQQKRWDWVVFDRRETSLEEYRQLHMHAPTLGLDEGGEARAYCTYLVDTFPRLTRTLLPNVYNPKFVPIDSWQGNAQESLERKKILLAFGGEDPLGLTEITLKALVEHGGFSREEIDVLLGPARSRDFKEICSKRLSSQWESRSYFTQYQWVFTSFGITPYEVIEGGAVPLLVNPTPYHEKLARAAGFYSLGVGRVLPQKLSRWKKNPQIALPPWANSENGRKSASFSDYFSTLTLDVSPSCPLCGKIENRATLRFPNRTYFSCSSCGMEYSLPVGSPKKEYTETYFFEEYKNQYGKTYLEDFPSIQKQGLRRLKVLKEYTTLEGKTLLDIGCALGPFLTAAQSEGMIPYGVDISEEAVRYVQKKLQIPAVPGDICSLDPATNFGVRTFDVISLWYVLEHIPKLGKLLDYLTKVIAPGGWLLFATPNSRGISAWVSREEFYRNNPMDHVTLWNPVLAKKILASYGFILRKVVIPNPHPERFPQFVQKILGEKGCKTIEILFKWGDTFEGYAQKISHDIRGRVITTSRHPNS